MVGGGDSACEEALHLTHTAEHVYLVHRRDTLRASKVMADRVLNHAKITMIWDSEVAEVFGEKKVEGVKIRNFKSNEVKELPVAGLFVGGYPRGCAPLHCHWLRSLKTYTCSSVSATFGYSCFACCLNATAAEPAPFP